MKRLQKAAALLCAGALCAGMLAGCGLNEKKAVELYKKSMELSQNMESAKFDGNVTLEVDLNGTAMSFDLGMDGQLQDKGATSAINVRGNVLGQDLETQTYMKDGKVYTQQQGTGDKYLVQDLEETTGMNYEALLSLSQGQMGETYINAVDTAENLLFAETEDGQVELSFDFSADAVSQLSKDMQDVLLDQMMGSMEEGMRQSTQQQLPAELLEQMTPEQQEEYQKMMEDTIAQTMEIIKGLFAGMTVDSLHLDVIMDPKSAVPTRQGVEMSITLPLGDLADALSSLGAADAQLPESVTFRVVSTINYTDFNGDFTVEMPEFTADNTLTMEQYTQQVMEAAVSAQPLPETEAAA